ncbi:MAG: hypothetical protein K2P81_07285 [Bacteriovoracaceae bacterium]|nr:hypothetical protein [Bacteriovoracaceae bacterium]
MEFVLSAHQSVKKSPYSVKGRISQKAQEILLEFEVEKQNHQEWIHHLKFSESDFRKNWELWNFDVVEAFLQLRNHPNDIHAPYVEIQVSPLNQKLALVILKPRVSFFTPLNLDFTSQTQKSDSKWSTQIKLTLPSALLSQGELWGGLFACLGSHERSYLALNPNPEDKPDFHRPELFKKL